ncbi:hypothetical protein T4B_1016 [Trichinella pseudospiralis]|uniref:Uncharacterized protein n=1 Tax=Trichinella pseudospiralis TaxID=6337 RepID=A0A0V1GCM4_TRIPS|nr:hypothetical protein T4B_1016 [Trichinella pseudospiralis]
MDGSVMCNVIFLKCVALLLPNFSCFLNNISAQIISFKLLKTVHSFCLFWCSILPKSLPRRRFVMRDAILPQQQCRISLKRCLCTTKKVVV